MRKLKPPKNLVETTPRCCATCRHRIEVAGAPECERQPETLPWDERIYFMVCDYYKAH